MVAADCRTYRLIPHARHPDNVAMREVMRSALVGHSAERLYALINDVERYPEFLPWCVRAVVESRTETEVVATLAINHGPLRTEFTTRNQLTPGREISMNLERGPFTSLTGAWTLTPIGESGCRVTLALRFEFSNRVTAALFEPVFEQTAASLVDAFVARAKAVHGPGS
jgi:ribosome-associated toxin RatA of RatAB toxin-antitoxin module